MNPVSQDNQENENSHSQINPNTEITNTFEIESAINVKPQTIFNYLHSSKIKNYLFILNKNKKLKFLFFF